MRRCTYCLIDSHTRCVAPCACLEANHALKPVPYSKCECGKPRHHVGKCLTPGGWTHRAIGAKCIHCKYRDALPHKRRPHLARNYCSTQCEDNAQMGVTRARKLILANEIRSLLNMSKRHGYEMTVREMESVIRRLRRLVPGFDQMARSYPHTLDDEISAAEPELRDAG